MITTANKSKASDNQLAIPAMSDQEARCIIRRYEEIVSVRTVVPDGWVNWHLEFKTGQFDDCTFDRPLSNARCPMGRAPMNTTDPIGVPSATDAITRRVCSADQHHIRWNPGTATLP